MDYVFVILSLTLLDSAFCSTVYVHATVRQDCVLPCNCSGDIQVDTLEWIQRDQQKDLLIYRGGTVQEISDRIQFTQLEIKDDMSVTLKSVTTEDTGTYECRVYYKDNQEDIQIIDLIVREKSEPTPHPSDTPYIVTTEVPLRGYPGLFFALTLVLLILLSIVLLLLLLKLKLFREVPHSFCSEKPKKTGPPSESSCSNSSKHTELLSREVHDPLQELTPYRGGGVCVLGIWNTEHVLAQSSSLTKSSSDPSFQRWDPDVANYTLLTAHISIQEIPSYL